MLRSLRRAGAVSKFLFAISLCAFAFVCEDWRILAGIVAALAGLLLASGVWDRSVSLIFGVSVLGLPTLLCLFLLGGIEKASDWRQGLLLGLAWLGVFSLRLIIVLLADVLVVKWTSFSDMLLSLRSLGLPGKAVLFVSALTSLLPAMFAMSLRVVEVQRARGFEARRLVRPSQFLPLFVPVFLAQMRRASELALSLELRGLAGDGPGAAVRNPACFGDAFFWLVAVLPWSGFVWRWLGPGA
ncbi:cobalt transport protein [Solidesulfovibrio carbinoliphilus subsp. oakridgensis]|uniref:Cobalt transport protein n=1 Tax=Solidesulfovibrio carbinoliphilus subsp. oakridgensis TaxID=694327 RepID=G7Q6R4_9BACT|nr:energy-coupling factor transporter transmembrane protein EcfT [Solidesulfovibrio carbinoliphilus]EHJ47999.1 cobalt transport protein [Solidesulfovibrio carbinoliphilus subsp. oakridgensis]